MKISEEYVIREVAGEYIIVPTGKAALNFNGLITVNDTGAFLWKQLQKGASKEDLIHAVTDEFETDEESAAADIEVFLEKIREEGILEG